MRVIKKLSNLLLKTLYLNGVFLTKNNFIIVLVTCLTFSVNFLFGQTNVSGVISANTTWTKLGSPYKLTGNMFLLEKMIKILKNISQLERYLKHK